MRALRPHHVLHAVQPRLDASVSPGQLLADIAVCQKQIALLEKRILADATALANAPAPVPVPTPTPPPVPNPGGGGGGVITWPSYTGVATPVGTSLDGFTNVFYDASLGPQGLTCAQQLVAAASAINAGNATLFGAPMAKVNVIVYALNNANDGTGGADHDGCDFSTGQNIEVDVDFTNPTFSQSLYEAELSENMMDGQLCGLSTGEALSRWAALVITPNAEFSQFLSAPVWAAAGFPNWVDKTEGTDGDYKSIGCGMAFISWLLGKHGVTLNHVAEEMVRLGNSGTLAGLYIGIGLGTVSPWATFLADVQALPGGVTSDDPFNALAVATV